MEITNGNITALVSGLAFLVIFLFLIGIFGYYRERAKKVRLIKNIRQGSKDWGQVHKEDPSLISEGSLKGRFISTLSFLGERVGPVKPTDNLADYRRMRLRFLKAGLHKANAPAIFWGTKVFLMISLPVSFFLVRITVFDLLDTTVLIALCIFFALFGFYLPDIWIHIKIGRRKRKISDGIPDALDLLVVCVEAGLGLDAAISRVAEELSLTNKPLSDEFKLLNMELMAGRSREDALRNLAVRTDLEDLNSLVTLLIQTDKFGTSIADALRVYSDSFRTKRYQRAEEIAAKLPVKLVFPSILFIFPSIFVVILGPAAIRIFQIFITT
jgi:tight adherence protein C